MPTQKIGLVFIMSAMLPQALQAQSGVKGAGILKELNAARGQATLTLNAELAKNAQTAAEKVHSDLGSDPFPWNVRFQGMQKGQGEYQCVMLCRKSSSGKDAIKVWGPNGDQGHFLRRADTAAKLVENLKDSTFAQKVAGGLWSSDYKLAGIGYSENKEGQAVTVFLRTKLPLPLTNGVYFPKVKRPTELAKLRQEVLARGNKARNNSDYRKNLNQQNGKPLYALNLTGGKTATGPNKTEVVYRAKGQLQDLTLDTTLNKAAQFHAEYMATRGYASQPASPPGRGHTGPAANASPTGTDMITLDNRVKHYGWTESTTEATGGPASRLDEFPANWMSTDTHYRPWFNVDGRYTRMGIGIAQDSNGKWWCVAVSDRLVNP